MKQASDQQFASILQYDESTERIIILVDYKVIQVIQDLRIIQVIQDLYKLCPYISKKLVEISHKLSYFA